MCKNDTRFKKNLWTCKNKGDAIFLYCVPNVIGKGYVCEKSSNRLKKNDMVC
ncbi:hypothetical protein [Blochmannia endosymbiont of Camponotus modoc]|uniref:hypothetical protein n=1 Tax=Blochmannia endosymbiont of Camponotus modoc TaxID=2945587 RepID=UPI002024580E|nr:hypothetical protein [Blochmannia endosymbiont of Camponotus modoc]URJ26635.1 hypothetical protein M9396_02770 [Blochmannia endosymbiont of Camponotus modoc]